MKLTLLYIGKLLSTLIMEGHKANLTVPWNVTSDK